MDAVKGFLRGKKGWLLLISLVWVVSLWPGVGSLYDLSGEESTLAQLRSTTHWFNAAIRPQPRLAPEAATDFVQVTPFGINTFLEQEVEVEKRARSLQLIHDAGFGFIRQEFPWEDIEIHGKGDFIDRRNVSSGVDSWEKYDNIVDLAQAQGIEILVRLGNPPAWTRALTDTIGTGAPPDDIRDFGDFASAVAARYRGRITYYQVWNEPNGNEEWGKRDVDPQGYTELLCHAYRRIKGVNPDAIILAGALTPTVAMDGRNMNDLIFLQRMYDSGAAACFDIMSAQGYGLWSGAKDRRLRPTVINYPHHLLLRDIMVRNGDAHKPIWISEMGWNDVPEELPAIYGRVTDAQQAKYAVEAYERALHEWPWIGVINYWYFKRAGDWERDQSWYYFRLLEPDFTPQPAFDALARFAKAAPAREQTPGWVNLWHQSRPLLFLGSSAILFFALLSGLAPPTRG